MKRCMTACSQTNCTAVLLSTASRAGLERGADLVNKRTNATCLIELGVFVDTTTDISIFHEIFPKVLREKVLASNRLSTWRDAPSPNSETRSAYACVDA